MAYHLLAQAGAARAPWPVTMIVSCLPVLVLAMGTTLAHMLRTDADNPAADGPDNTGTAGPATARSPAWSAEDQAVPAQDQSAGQRTSGSRSPATTRTVPKAAVHRTADGTRTAAPPETDQARLIASRLTAAGKRVSRRALRSEGIKGSNQALDALAGRINAEMAGRSSPSGQS